MIKKISKTKWRLYSTKGGKHKNLGTFSSLAAAKKHEREVNYFKHETISLEEVLDLMEDQEKES